VIIICKCGHEDNAHDDEGFCADCNFNGDLDFEGIEVALTHRFVPDNLSTIERIAKERGLL
jgi:hypothetical protein